MEFQFQRKRINKMAGAKILDELEKVAKHFNYIEFSHDDFDKVAGISQGVVRKHFDDSWKKALDALRLRLQQKGLALSPRPHSPNRVLSDKNLFDEMERIWQKVGQRPSQSEWETSEPKMSYQTYKKRFGGWKNACLKFIEYKMGKITVLDNSHAKKEYTKTNIVKIKNKEKRDIPLKILHKVFEKYNYRCVFCGRSPATELEVKLHIDHIIPVAKGGKTIIENLQLLCLDCNLGKCAESKP